MAKTRATGRSARDAAPSPVGAYRDFVISARRLDGRKVAVSVDASPAGRLDELVPVVFPAREVAALHRTFLSGLSGGGIDGGRMLITREQATAIGTRLAAVLLPPKVFALLAESLSRVVAAKGGGLRIRLAMDPALMDLPWEYVCRPDHRGEAGLSGFLLLDPRISLVRHAADTSVRLAPIAGRQRLAFVGTMWEHHRDGWDVGREYRVLRDALGPVAEYVRCDFQAASRHGLDRLDGAAIFHYAGHSDWKSDGRPFLLRELPTSRPLADRDVVHVDEIAQRLARAGTRLAVLSACNSGFHAVVRPFLAAGVPAVIGVNGGVASISTIEFCAKLYESLAVGLSLDDAVVRARLHVMEWGAEHGLFDWGLYMVHLVSPDAVLFPRAKTRTVTAHQRTVEKAHAETVGSTLELAKRMDGLNFGSIMSELTRRRVLILGRFIGRRRAVLEAIRDHLSAHRNRYMPELFTYEKPESRDLGEAIIGFAALSRFVIADLSEAKSVPAELQAIAPTFQSVPIVPLLNRGGKAYANFDGIARRPNVVQPTIRYRDVDDLLARLDAEVIPQAEAVLARVRPPA